MRLSNLTKTIITLGALLFASACSSSESPGGSGSTAGSNSGSTAGSSGAGGGSAVCSAVRTMCSGDCIDLSSDPDNCGSCGSACSGSEVCSSNACKDSCESGETACNRACVDVDNDLFNCGSCGNACAGGQLCTAGKCEGLPDSRDVPGVGEPGFDPSVDPGVHPAFIDDPDLTRNETYVYEATKAGDHDLAEGIVAIDYDVTGSEDLRAVLTKHLTELKAGHGLALYLINGTALNDADLFFLQMLNVDGDGLALTNLDTLHVYNLLSLQGGVESTNEAERSYGIPYPFLWKNGWQSPDSEIMKGAGGWVKHIVMDDLEEIKAGTFCDTMFETISFKGVKVVRQMGFGFAPRGSLTYIYMPSLEEVEQHAFRRRQRVIKYNMPRLKIAGRFAFDDNTQAQFYNMPSLINPSTGDVEDTRNTFNDPRDMIAFNFPKMEYLGLSCMGGTNDTTTVFRFPSVINFEGGSLQGHTNVQFVWAPEATRIGPNMFVNDTALVEVYAPKVTDLQRTAFQGCTALKHLELPSATIIRINAFDGATALEEVRFPVVTEIQDEAFMGLPNLKSVHLGDTPPKQGTNVFTGTNPALVIYHTGNDPAWDSWSPVGNSTATVVAE